MGLTGGSDNKESACKAVGWGLIPELLRFPGKQMATHYSILVWRISWTEEPGGLQSMEWQRGVHDWGTKHTASKELKNTIFKPKEGTNEKLLKMKNDVI